MSEIFEFKIGLKIVKREKKKNEKCPAEQRLFNNIHINVSLVYPG